MDGNGLMVTMREFQSSQPRSFPRWEGYDLLVDVDIVNPLLKKQWERNRRSNIVVFVV